jgi:putative PIN family toxin of toxin-antitoxin system
MTSGKDAPPRLVLDTNTVVSALLFPGGRLSWLRAAWQGRRFIPLISKVTASELLRVLAYPKFKLTADEQQDLLGDYLPWCEVVDVRPSKRKLPDCRDPADLPFLQLALAAKADGLISGDNDILVLKDQLAIPVIEPAEAKEFFGL